mgnify:CR=1 FL=1
MKKSNQQQTTNPIDKKEEVQKTKDEHIDQDFPGYPNSPSREKTINPETKKDRANARLIKKEKNKEEDDDEQNSDGSANAFGESEQDVLRGEMDYMEIGRASCRERV